MTSYVVRFDSKAAGSRSMRRNTDDIAMRMMRIRDEVFALVGPTALPPIGKADSLHPSDALSVLTHYCVERMNRAKGADSSTVDQLGGAVLELHQLAMDVYLHRMTWRTERLADCSAALNLLRSVPSTADLLDRVCEDAAVKCGFSRVVLSRVDGGMWKPWKRYFDSGDVTGAWFSDWVDREIPLEDRSPETKVMDDRRPSIVYDTENSPVYRPIIVESGHSRSYVVSAMVLEDNVVGLIHADHYPIPSRIDDVDRDVLWAFTEGLGYVYERTLLIERLRTQREQIREIFTSTLAEMDDLYEANDQADRIGEVSPRPANRADSVADSSVASGGTPMEKLTSRERDVFDLMSAGATNGDIAQSLVITEGTVKSHVKHILRKLGAVNRSQAIAWSISSRLP